MKDDSLLQQFSVAALAVLAIPTAVLVRALTDLYLARCIWHWFWEDALGQFPGTSFFLGIYMFVAIFKERDAKIGEKEQKKTTTEKCLNVFATMVLAPAIIWAAAWFLHKVMV